MKDEDRQAMLSLRKVVDAYITQEAEHYGDSKTELTHSEVDATHIYHHLVYLDEWLDQKGFGL